jgi:hypothetical protein
MFDICRIAPGTSSNERNGRKLCDHLRTERATLLILPKASRRPSGKLSMRGFFWSVKIARILQGHLSAMLRAALVLWRVGF